MQKIPIKYAQPGMKLAKPVVNDKGLVLCGEGTILTDNIIASLKRRDITTIYVEGNPVELPSMRLKPLSERLEELNKRFEKVSDPLTLKLKKAIEDFWRLLEEENENNDES